VKKQNKLKCGNLQILPPRLYADASLYFNCCVIPRTTVFKHTHHLRRYTAATEYTSNMAAVTTVDGITPPSTHVYFV